MELMRGNNNYALKVGDKLLRTLSEKGQEPKAIVVACSDSRVPVEVIFDALQPGLLFVIRVAGNIVSGPVVIGSIEFAIRQLRVPCIILLGHTDCGAVSASIDGISGEERGVQLCRFIKCKSEDLEEAVVENLGYQFRNILKIECVRDGIRNGVLEAYTMIYDLQKGRINVHSRAVIINGKALSVSSYRDNGFSL